MISEVIIVSKKRAKEMIDKSPGNYVVLSKVNFPSIRLSKDISKLYIEESEQIKYSNNDIFGILSMQKSIADAVNQNILFAQSHPS